MDTPTPARPLQRQECLALLSRTSLGRIVTTDAGLPAVWPVLCRSRKGIVTIRYLPGAGSLSPGTVVGLQADQIDPDSGTGWTVLVIGPCFVLPVPASSTKEATADRDDFHIHPAVTRGYVIAA